MFASLLNVDVDECTAFPNICGANTDCHNTDGSYTCICKAGYTGDGKTCFGKGLELELEFRIIDTSAVTRTWFMNQK